MYAEVEKVQNGPIQDWELEKARNAARRSLVGNLSSSLQRAILLARYAVFFNDPGIINTRYERIASLKIDDLQRVAGSISFRRIAPSWSRCPRQARRARCRRGAK